MSDSLARFHSTNGPVTVVLPFEYHSIIADWAALRRLMARSVPSAFTRDEWAYLITFLDPENLLSTFTESFGAPLTDADGHDEPDAPSHWIYRPRGAIAVWLPNNVSLLGPLTLILLSLTGQRIRLKLGSLAEDLCGEFLKYAVTHLPDGALRGYLESRVTAETFERGDRRQLEFAEESAVRIVFGSDDAASAIHALPHPVDSVGFSFADRRSEAWIAHDAADDAILTTLIKVFAIYGQAGCTSPRRVVVPDGTPEQARSMRDRVAELWPQVIRHDPPMHVASSNLLASQWALALGWDTRVTERHGAVLACGSIDLEAFDSPMALRFVAASREQAVAGLPDNIQTLGHALTDPTDSEWLRLLAGTPVLRFVPLARMHHFGAVWDGQDYWRQCFSAMEVHS
ncbi:acyl-CoA reductase [Elongatibacter sediminis]|uniref:Acyl-CoA reductase n=1 Tax=Elongatibacter sediminis TaxID=3119006 RepID=A0AAW9RH97_9GAMM